MIVVLFSFGLAHLVLGADQDASATPALTCSPCKCVKNVTDCSGLKLQTIPITLPRAIVDLNLDDNSFISYSHDKGICEIYKDLKRVTLVGNSLREVHEIFKGCGDTLQEINLAGNPLSSISSEKVFVHLRSLAILKGLTVSGPLKRELFTPMKRLRHFELTYDEPSFPRDLLEDLKNLRILCLTLVNALSVRVDDTPLIINVLDELYLNGPKIKELPASFFTNLTTLTKLDLELPKLKSLRWPNQQFSSLKHLSVNGVWVVDPATLAGMPNLQTLLLTDIDNLNYTTLFAEQQKLEVLKITDCSMQKLPSSWFSKLESLHDLNLTDNRLEELNPDDLIGLSNLQNLVLSMNRIEKIPQGFLKHVADNLQSLFLNRNMLATLQKEDFPLMKNLKTLDISQNKLVDFDLSSSQLMPNLFSLQLQHNKIRKMNGILTAETKRVNASYNKLDYVPKGLMIESLVDLDLSANPLTLPVSEIMRLKNLKELTIFRIIVKCDCRMQQLIKSKVVVHGGQCKNEENEISPKSLDNILNELICDVSPVAASTDYNSSITKNSQENSTSFYISPSVAGNEARSKDVNEINGSSILTMLSTNAKNDNKTVAINEKDILPEVLSENSTYQKSLIENVLYENKTDEIKEATTSSNETVMKNATSENKIKEATANDEKENLKKIPDKNSTSQEVLIKNDMIENTTEITEEMEIEYKDNGQKNSNENSTYYETLIRNAVDEKNTSGSGVIMANDEEDNPQKISFKNSTYQETPIDDTNIKYTEQNVTHPTKNESLVILDKNVKETSMIEDNADLDAIIFSLITITIFIIIIFIIAMIWRRRRFRSTNLNHRSKNTLDDESEPCKLNAIDGAGN